METNKSKVISSLMWKFLERGGTQGIQFIVQLVLARLLLPEEYGVIALTTIFITLANVFVQSGFGTALIQKKEIDKIDLSSVFFINLLVALILYVIIFFTSPFVAQFYNMPILVPVLRVLSITLFFGGINSVQNAIISRKMQFKLYFYSSLSGIIISGITGIVLAYLGFGVWALVANQLVNIIIITVVLGIIIKWKPILKISWIKIKELFGFGWKILFSSILDTVYNEIYGLVIGKIYNSETLGYYNRGQQFPKLLATNIDGSISSVMLPTLSSQQENKENLKNIMRRAVMTSSFILFPIMFGLAAIAEPMVRLVLTDKWLLCVPFIQLLSISYAFIPIHTANLQAINAIGRSDIYLKLEVVKKIVGVIVLCISIPFGIYVMAAMKIVTSIISTFINAYPNKKLLNYSFMEQIKDILPAILIAAFMAIIVTSITLLNLNVAITLLLQLIIGGSIYIGVSYIIKLESFMYLLSTIKIWRK